MGIERLSVEQGEFIDGEISGQGQMVWANGNIYTGDFVRGEKEGQGTLRTNDGDVYEGQWKRNLREGNEICALYLLIILQEKVQYLSDCVYDI